MSQLLPQSESGSSSLRAVLGLYQALVGVLARPASLSSMLQETLETVVDYLGAAGAATAVWDPTAALPVVTASCGALAGLKLGDWLVREPIPVPLELINGLAVEWGEVIACTRDLTLLGATTWLSHRGEYGTTFLVGPRGMPAAGWRQDALAAAVGLVGHAMERMRLGQEMEARLAQRDARWSSLYDIGVALTRELDRERLLDEVVRRAMELLHARGGVLSILDDATGDSIVKVAYIDGAPSTIMLGQRSSAGDGLVGQVVRSGEPLLVLDHAFVSRGPDALGARTSVVVAPLFVQGTCAGVLAVGDYPEHRRFTTDEIQTLALLAQQAGAVLERERSSATHDMLTIHRERARFARELHDGLAQNLASLLLKAELCHDLAHGAGPELERELDVLADGLQQAIRETRTAIFSLRDLVADGQRLGDSLRLFVARFEEHARVPVTLLLEGDVERASTPAIHVALVGVLREALMNVRKHAHATRVCVKLNAGCPNFVELSVEDDGNGFDLTQLRQAAEAGHFGVLSMRARMDELGGALRIESKVGHGTKVSALLPLTPSGDPRRAEDHPPTRR